MHMMIADWPPPFGQVMLKLLPLGVLVVWFLLAVDWKKAWPVLAAGGWAPLVLIALMGAAVWSFVVPGSIQLPVIGSISSGVWHFIAAAFLVGVVLFCGWLQSRSAYAPPEFNLDEPAHHHGEHEHHHAHH